MVDEDLDAQRGALDRALDVLEALTTSGGPAALADIAVRVQLPKPTTHRILKTLASRGYARQDGNGQYLPGMMILSLSGQMSETLDLGELALPVMQVLQQHLPETVHLSMLAGDHAVYVAKLDGQRPVRTASRVGDRLRLHCTSMGKAMLAYLEPEDRRHRLGTGDLERRTPHTITTLAQLETELDEIRSRGFSIDNEENQEQIRGVGAPVFDRHGHPIGALSLSAPVFALPFAMAQMLGPTVTAAARDLSLSLGVRPDRLPSPYLAAPTLEAHVRRVSTA